MDIRLGFGGNDYGRPEVVTILSTDRYFTSSGCGTWTADANDPIIFKPSSFEDGTWIVGVDLAPGTYRSNANDFFADGCAWARLRDFTGSEKSIIDGKQAQVVDPDLKVTIQATDRGFMSDGCYTWTRVS